MRGDVWEVGVLELWGVENRSLSLTWPMAYTTACTTVQAVITWITTHLPTPEGWKAELAWLGDP